MELFIAALAFIGETARDVLPIAVFLFAFQHLVIGKPMSDKGNGLILRDGRHRYEQQQEQGLK